MRFKSQLRCIVDNGVAKCCKLHSRGTGVLLGRGFKEGVPKGKGKRVPVRAAVVKPLERLKPGKFKVQHRHFYFC